VLTTSQHVYLQNVIAVQSTQNDLFFTFARPSASAFITNYQPLFSKCITCEISFLLHYVNFILFWFASSCTYHLITIPVFTLAIYYSVTQLAFHSIPYLFHKSFLFHSLSGFTWSAFIWFWTRTGSYWAWPLFVLISFLYVFFIFVYLRVLG